MSNILDNSHSCTIMENTLEKWGDSNKNCKLTDYLMVSAKLPFEIPDDCLKETFATVVLFYRQLKNVVFSVIYTVWCGEKCECLE